MGINVLTSAPILVPGTLYNFSFIDSTYVTGWFNLTAGQLWQWYITLRITWFLDLVTHLILKKRTHFGVWIYSFLRCGGTYWAGTDRCSESLDNTCQEKYLTPCMGKHTQQKVTAVCTQWNVYRIIASLVTAMKRFIWWLPLLQPFMQDWHFRADHGLLRASAFVKCPK